MNARLALAAALLALSALGCQDGITEPADNGPALLCAGEFPEGQRIGVCSELVCDTLESVNGRWSHAYTGADWGECIDPAAWESVSFL